MMPVTYGEYLQAEEALLKIQREKDIMQYMIDLRAKVKEIEKNSKSPVNIEVVAI